MSAAVRPRPGEPKTPRICERCGHAEHPYGTCLEGPAGRPILRCACGSDRPTPAEVGKLVADLEFLGFAVDPEWKKRFS